jgi:hypothetical protein
LVAAGANDGGPVREPLESNRGYPVATIYSILGADFGYRLP